VGDHRRRVSECLEERADVAVKGVEDEDLLAVGNLDESYVVTPRVEARGL